jgi:hypothetical protein
MSMAHTGLRQYDAQQKSVLTSSSSSFMITFPPLHPLPALLLFVRCMHDKHCDYTYLKQRSIGLAKIRIKETC